MKQPELGRKIAELRNQKRLTQEELVEKCNISVRTIQRIESGEVTPRDFTVKAIFSALEVELDKMEVTQKEDERKETGSFANLIFLHSLKPSFKLTTLLLNLGWISGIIYFILRFIESMVEVDRFVDDFYFKESTYAITKVLILITFILFQAGFLAVGAYFNKPFLKKVSAAFILASILIIGLDLLSIFTPYISYGSVALFYSLGYGIMGIIFGYALLKLDLLGNASKIAGMFEIFAGLVSITVIFAIAGPFILIPAEILEIIILIRASEEVKAKRTVSLI